MAEEKLYYLPGDPTGVADQSGVLAYGDSPPNQAQSVGSPGSSLDSMTQDQIRTIISSMLTNFTQTTRVQSGSLESGDFVTGVSGWKLSSNEGIEANNGTFRGTITATTGIIGGFTIGATTISSAGIILDSGNNVIKSTNYSAGNTGFLISPDLIETQNIHARGTFSTVVFEKDTISAVGGVLQVSNADVLDANMTALDSSTLTITGASSFTANDMLHIKDATDEEYLRVTSAASAPTYSVTRDLASAYASNNNPAWTKGAAVVKEGRSDGASTYSGGFLRLFGEGTNSPYYSVYARTGVAYNAITEIVRMGNLNGIGSFAADTFGIFMGSVSTGKYASFDTVTGNLVVNGYVVNSQSIFGGSGADGALAITSGTTTVNLGGAAIVVKNYTSISITGTGALAFSNPHANGTVVILKSVGNVTITSSATPAIQLLGVGAAAGTGGTSSSVGTVGTTGNAILDTLSHHGLVGANFTTGGLGGVIYSTNTLYSSTAINASLHGPWIATGSGGAGGSGGDNSGQSGGDGGRGGGALSIECGGALNFTGTISVNGQDGTQGGDGTGVPGGGGGGGGSAGMVVIRYNTLTANSGTITSAGGNGGNGGAENGGAAHNGGSGGGGAGGVFGAGGNGATSSAVAGDAATGLGAGGGGGSGKGTGSGAGGLGGAGSATYSGVVAVVI